MRNTLYVRFVRTTDGSSLVTPEPTVRSASEIFCEVLSSYLRAQGPISTVRTVAFALRKHTMYIRHESHKGKCNHRVDAMILVSMISIKRTI